MKALCSCGWTYPAASAREADSALRGHVLRCGGDGMVLNDSGESIETLERDVRGRVVPLCEVVEVRK